MTTIKESEISEKEMNFSDTNLCSEVLQAIKEKGYEEPTPIQKGTIPAALDGRDIIGSAPTGTGKTAAFALPILSRLASGETKQVLVLSPTRELARQAEDNFRIYGQYLEPRMALIYGGVPYEPQIKALKNDPQIIIATPGRLLDHVSEKNIHMKKVDTVVLDEVDRMLDMGFIDDVRRIIRYCSDNRQTMLFTATMPDAINRLANWALHDPLTVDAGQRRMPAESISHVVYPVDAIQKYDLLLAILRQENAQTNSVIVFTRTKRDADRVSEWLEAHEFSCVTLHSDRRQNDRQKALESFKEGKTTILVATDVASRGLDISDVYLVINYNVPDNPEDYVHRIGRTGRAQKAGKAATLFSSDEYSYLVAIDRYLGAPIERKKQEEFAYRNEPAVESAKVSKKAPKSRLHSRSRKSNKRT